MYKNIKTAEPLLLAGSQTHRPIHRDPGHIILLSYPENRALIRAKVVLTNGQAVVSNSDGGGPHWHAAGQAAQHGLNRVAFGFLAMEHHLLLQLHRFKLDVTLWKRLKKCVLVQEDLLETVAGSIESDALTSLSDLNFA
ncbi:hypothetical protein F7725_027727 [Dissostichus mawsoni]|uniref:Uncharacterized protein n=1 Tax=Dissostichus mawsoni TaxID=36200 RepID=A0A7J5XEP0_DISMA|nr:hypothetical protein F7725_027727 [Dissostichus mawsoni]